VQEGFCFLSQSTKKWGEDECKVFLHLFAPDKKQKKKSRKHFTNVPQVLSPKSARLLKGETSKEMKPQKGFF
jgi:hypothetical protein